MTATAAPAPPRNVTTRRGDLLAAPADALVNPVNTVGVMGKGLALSFKKAYPGNFRAYTDACATGRLYPGIVLVFDTRVPGPGRYVINVPTKRHWRNPSLLGDVQAGLDAMVDLLNRPGCPITSVAVPALGCGLGGLAWKQVEPLILTAAAATPQVTWYVYPPR
jgi:O-acetyl-ADP-ribose deacetylase (regulator of RNase III)